VARGITEIDVHTAADELVTKGERPTVERVRAHLGTGSPNTVTRWLETWWQGLGTRLHGHADRISIPEAPEAVLELAGQWWSLALASARSQADLALADDRARLDADRVSLEQLSAALEARSRSIDEQLGVARHAEQLALAQTGELQRLVSQLQGQLAETSLQRDAALSQADQAREACSQLQRQLDHQLASSQAERTQLTEHVRAVENRAHQEVDRSRQEIKELRALLSAANKERTRQEKEAVTNAQRAGRELTRAIQDASAQRARADVLETQLSQLKDLPAAVRAALVQAKPNAALSKRRAKRSPAKRQT
jgi:chromosome segregation ATPase